ncbi:MAG: acyltransferase [Rhodopila sp.]|jgi:peptidoglycan/LPS O-acetylase OafA/YrhL
MAKMENQAEPLPKRMPTLDGLRGVAALIVMFGHATAVIYQDPAAPRKGLAVAFFFMLSGFVLAHAYQGKLTHGLSLGGFLRVRAIRLYPMIIAASILSFVVRFLVDGRFHLNAAWLTATLAALLGLPSPPIPPNVYGYFPLNAPEWSLFYELALSALFGIVLYRLKSRHIAVTASVALTGDIVLRAIYKIEADVLWTESFGAIAAFCIGVLLLRFAANDRVSRRSIPLIVLAVPIVAATFMPHSVGWWFDIAAVNVIFPAVILGGVYTRNTTSLPRILGGISYPLYILHWPIMVACNNVLVPRIGSAMALASVCIFSISTSWLALKIFDEPVRAWLTRINAPIFGARSVLGVSGPPDGAAGSHRLRAAKIVRR